MTKFLQCDVKTRARTSFSLFTVWTYIKGAMVFALTWFADDDEAEDADTHQCIHGGQSESESSEPADHAADFSKQPMASEARCRGEWIAKYGDTSVSDGHVQQQHVMRLGPELRRATYDVNNQTVAGRGEDACMVQRKKKAKFT